MQKEHRSYDNFPFWAPLLSYVLSISIYALGACIFSQIDFFYTVLYLMFCLWVELRILRYSCVNCYYYGKTCGLGRGKLCALFFEKGDTGRFAEKEISWKDLIPDFMVLIFPLVGGIIVLIRDFTWLVLVLMVVLFMLSMGGNAVVRGSLACKFCKQKELTGCPAERLFNKQAKTSGS